MNHQGTSRLRVAHVITDLRSAGAQNVMARLIASGSDAFEHRVLALGEWGPVGEDLRGRGADVEALSLRSIQFGRGLVAARRWLREADPDLVQTWMYHADLLGGLAARSYPPPVVWNLRQSDLEPGSSKRTTIWTARACALMSRLVPRKIVCGSRSAREVHAALGYDGSRMVVIPNGFDTERFRPDRAVRDALRAEWGVTSDQLLVGMFGRSDPQKHHAAFFAAAQRVIQVRSDVQFLLVGEGVGRSVEAVDRRIDPGRFRILDHHADVERLMAACDLCVSTSRYGEGLPNVIGEAMACGVPCAATDVGDARTLIGDTGAIAPPGDVEAIADSWLRVLSLEQGARRELGLRARARITAHYPLSAMVEAYENLYREVAACAG